MAYIPWWQRMSPPTFAERFDLGGLAGRTWGIGDRPGFNDGSSGINLAKGERLPKNKNILKWEKANPTVKFDSLSATLRSKIRKTGDIKLGVTGSGQVKGVDNPFYKPLTKNGEKIAMHVYGTTDITNSQRWGINRGETTMSTKSVKWKAGDISVKPLVRSGHEVKEVVFKNKKMEKDFIKYLKLRANQPLKDVVDYGNKWFSQNFPISKRQADKAIPYLMKKHNINYIDAPKTESGYSQRATRQTLKKTSSVLEEGRIATAKTKILKDLNLKKKIDFAHRTSKAHMARLGLQFDTSLTGMDSRVINQVILRPSEKKLDRLYSEQFKIFEQLKNNPTDKLLKEQLVDINKQVKAIIKTTSGRLVGVTIDPHTLEASFEGVKKKYSLTKFIGENMTLKELEKLSPADQQKFLTKQLTNAVNAEVKKGFVPSDFKKILTNSKSREAILKYAKKLGPAVVKQLEWALKNPNSKVALKLLSKLSAGEGFITEDILKKQAQGKTVLESVASPLFLDKAVHKGLKRSVANDQQNLAYDRANLLRFVEEGKADISNIIHMATKDPDFDGRPGEYIEWLKMIVNDPHQQRLIRERDIETEEALTLPPEKVAERGERYKAWKSIPAVQAVEELFKSDEQKAQDLENLLNV